MGYVSSQEGRHSLKKDSNNHRNGRTRLEQIVVPWYTVYHLSCWILKLVVIPTKYKQEVGTIETFFIWNSVGKTSSCPYISIIQAFVCQWFGLPFSISPPSCIIWIAPSCNFMPPYYLYVCYSLPHLMGNFYSTMILYIYINIYTKFFSAIAWRWWCWTSGSLLPLEITLSAAQHPWEEHLTRIPTQQRLEPSFGKNLRKDSRVW